MADRRNFFDESPRKRIKLNLEDISPRAFNSDIFEEYLSNSETFEDLNNFVDFDDHHSLPQMSQSWEDSGLHINSHGISPSCDLDVANNGDSGFNELTSPGSASCTEFNGGDCDEPENFANSIRGESLDENESSSFTDDSIDKSSVISGFSDLIDQDDSPTLSHRIAWVSQQMRSARDPRAILEYLCPSGMKITFPEHVDDCALWNIVYNVMNEPPRREKLDNINSFDDVLNLLSTCKKIIVLTGAGVSVSCGIPDFRSRNGIYARLAKDFPDLPDPQAMFDMQYFTKDPRPFYKFAKEIFPGSFEPSPCHKFIKLLEERKQLLRNYTQNIDTLEKVVGISNVVECHGSFATASCLNCAFKVDSSAIKDDVFSQRIPYCSHCSTDPSEGIKSVLKPDIVFFGEGLPDEFHSAIELDKEECDLLIVIGSSLKVRPVALIPNSLPSHVPQVLINREPLSHCSFDIELLGDCDVIVNEICRRLGEGWKHLCYSSVCLDEINEADLKAKGVNEHPSGSADEDSHFSQNGSSDIECSLSGDNINLKEVPLSPEIPGLSGAVEGSSGEQESNKVKVISSIPENSYVFCQPSRYLFKGAEVYDSDLDGNYSEKKKYASLTKNFFKIVGSSQCDDYSKNGLNVDTEKGDETNDKEFALLEHKLVICNSNEEELCK
ncbi:NAD-dependent histone deacetylase sir2 [Chamberlinius hualienensis]